MAARLTAYLVALIVGVTFVAGLIVGAQRNVDGPVDLIVVNGNVYTADGDHTMAEAVAVQGNKILLVGSNREIQRLRRPQTVVVDANGGAVLPGFNDTTSDFIADGLALEHVNLAGATTRMAAESSITAWAALHPDQPWVLGRDWSDDAFAGRAPTRQMLDALVPDRPAFLITDEGERAWVNTAALTRARITRRTPNPADGTIVKDSRTGEPTGILLGSAIDLVSRVLPEPTKDEQRAALRGAIDDAHRRGVTSVQDLSASADNLELYDSLRREQALDLRVYAALRGRVDMTAAELEALDAVRAKYADDPLLKTGAITLVAEDAAEDELRDMVRELDARGWQVIIHAIGESAIRIAKDVVEFASGTVDDPQRVRRHRVEEAANSDPVHGVQLAVAEKRPLSQAVNDVTRDAAWSSFDEHRKGTIEPEMLADLVILTSDIFAPGAKHPVDVDVAVTIFDGRVVYTRPTQSND